MKKREFSKKENSIPFTMYSKSGFEDVMKAIFANLDPILDEIFK